MYSYIVNPLTNKKISIFSKNGKKVLKNFIYQLQFGGSDFLKTKKKENEKCVGAGAIFHSNCEKGLDCYA